MRKLIYVMVAFFLLGCSSDTVTDSPVILERGNPNQQLEATDTTNMGGVDRDYLIWVLDNEVTAGYNTISKNIVIGYLPYDCFAGEDCDNTTNYNDVNYKISVYNSEGLLVHEDVIDNGFRVSYSNFKGKYAKSGTFTVVFDDYPEVTSLIQFIIP